MAVLRPRVVVGVGHAGDALNCFAPDLLRLQEKKWIQERTLPAASVTPIIYQMKPAIFSPFLLRRRVQRPYCLKLPKHMYSYLAVIPDPRSWADTASYIWPTWPSVARPPSDDKAQATCLPRGVGSHRPRRLAPSIAPLIAPLIAPSTAPSASFHFRPHPPRALLLHIRYLLGNRRSRPGYNHDLPCPSKAIPLSAGEACRQWIIWSHPPTQNRRTCPISSPALPLETRYRNCETAGARSRFCHVPFAGVASKHHSPVALSTAMRLTDSPQGAV